jgi:spore germination protein YaaH
MKRLFIFGIFVSLTFFSPLSLFATAKEVPLAVSGWIPYWKEGAATSSIPYLNKLTAISPFSYTVKSDGTLANPMKTDNAEWTTLFVEARKQGVKIYPSILWTDKNQMEATLSYKKKRAEHIKMIVAEVKTQNLDGIDIDYEGKLAETRDGYSRFVTELSAALKKDKKKLICTVEARTPIDSRYSKVTAELLARIEYANDYKAIGKACDEVRIMAYDQSSDDLQLVNKYASTLYKPVADIAWVRKVITLALEDIPAKKLHVGVATYGYKYEINASTSSTSPIVTRIGAMNYFYADELAKNLRITPTRNQAGELSFTYSTTTTANGISSLRTYLVWYSDAQAVADKVKLAKLYKLGGVSIFKLDGAYDQSLFNTFPILRK